MSSQILATGLGGATLKAVLQEGLRRTKPNALGVAVAYVSVVGFDFIQHMVDRYEIKRLRLVTDTKDGVTHPTALATALDRGWDVRVVDRLPGTFHPKLYVGGGDFDEDAGVADISFVLVGSANLSSAALERNGECSQVRIAPTATSSAGAAWKECWVAGTNLTASRLAAYEKYFALRNRHRSPADLVTLGVTDEPVPTKDGEPAKNVKPPRDAQKAISNTAASTAWAGLQSFTGDYNLQVEFPRDAGSVLSRLLGISEGTADFLCEDGRVRPFLFRYYTHNGMFRLNVHNDTPVASWARAHKRGIAVVESEDGRLKFLIIRPGQRMIDVIGRSLALGTWGRTSTRLYGWY